jgi:NADP-dependent 3-hydroxy acid dehydrogenase YdfG
VLASRHAAALQAWVKGIGAREGTARSVPTDVTHKQLVQKLGTAVVDALGTFDVCGHPAAVTLFGLLTKAPKAEFRRVIDTNVSGYVHGSVTGRPAASCQ